MIIWKWSGPRTRLCLPRVRSHLTVGDPVASGILRLSKSNTLISRNIILACNWKESRKIKDYDEICLRGPNSVVDFFFLLVMATQTVAAWSADFLFIYLFIYVVVYVTDHRCFSSQGDWRLAYPWLWWSSFEVLSNFVVVIYYITIWKWVNSNKLFFFYKVLVESFSTNLTWFLFPSMLQFLSFVIIYAVEWCLSVCSVLVLEKFLVESRKRLEIPLILHYFALWLVQKTQATNQSDAKLKPITTWSPAFSRALVTLVVFNLNSRCLFKVFFLFSDWLSWLLNLCFITLSRKSLYIPDTLKLMVAWVWTHCLPFFPQDLLHRRGAFVHQSPSWRSFGSECRIFSSSDRCQPNPDGNYISIVLMLHDLWSQIHCEYFCVTEQKYATIADGLTFRII